MRVPQPRLFHFCCSHSAAKIDVEGVLRPTPVSWAQLDRALLKEGLWATGLAGRPTVLWLTDMDEPIVDDLGLTSSTIACDRTEVRYEVECDAMQWQTWALLNGAHHIWQRELERYGKPRRWFVTSDTVPVLSRQPSLQIANRGAR